MADLIERSALMETMRQERDRIAATYGENDEYVRCLDKYAMSMVEDAKTVDAVPVVHGHWERKYSRPGVYADLLWHCSVCGAKFRDNWADHYKRCPECGAFMDGKDDNGRAD